MIDQASSFSDIGRHLRAYTNHQGGQCVLVLWDVDETLLTDDRTKWVTDGEDEWIRECLSVPCCHHLLLSAGSTHDLWSKLLQVHTPRFGVPDAIGNRVFRMPDGAVIDAFTLLGIKGISTNVAVRHHVDPRELYLDHTKLDIVRGLVAQDGCFHQVVFIDNNLHEFGFGTESNQIYSQFVHWLGCNTEYGERIRLIHMRTGSMHPVFNSRGGVLSGLLDDDYRRLLASRSVIPEGDTVARCARRNHTTHTILREIMDQVTGFLKRQLLTRRSVSSLFSLINVLLHGFPIVDNHIRCQMIGMLLMGTQSQRTAVHHGRIVNSVLHTWHCRMCILLRQTIKDPCFDVVVDRRHK